MEDPWSSGPSTWGSDKPSVSLPSLEEPPATIDVSDPWGSGASSGPSLPSLPLPTNLPDLPSGQTEPETPGWSAENDSGWSGEHAESVTLNVGQTDQPADLPTPRATTPIMPESPITSELSPRLPQHAWEPPQPEPTTSFSSPRRPSISSEGGWAGDERPYSPPPSPPAPVQSIREESWGDEDLEATLEAENRPPRLTFTPPPTFHSPKFEPFSPGSADGFGVFSSTVNVFPDDNGLDEGDEGGGWGGLRSPVIMQHGSTADKEEDWEQAQRRLREAEERVPREKVEKIKDAWKEVVLSMVVDRLEALSEEEERKLEQGVKTLGDETYETVRSLAVIPPDINTYPPVISSLATHERHAYALSRPNSSPSTSLLTVSLSRRPRRQTATDTESSWLNRSKLGEPDAPVLESSPAAEAAPSKWSFWRKQTQDKPLVTSGGGILEVKSSTTPALSRTSSEMKVGSKAGSIMSKNSRPSSPASSLPVAASMEDLHEPNVAHIIDTSATTPTKPASNAPLAAGPPKSRFWGILGRNKTPAQQAAAAAGDGKDLEISADEFSFLSEIPSLNGRDHHAVGDLLSVDAGRSEDIASLESMLSSKPTALPAPLAPPPRITPIPRIPSTGGGRFVAKMKEAPPTDFDLLGGLDFHSPSSTPPPPIAKSSPAKDSSTSLWDDFLAPTGSTSSDAPRLSAISPPPVLSSIDGSPAAHSPSMSAFGIQAPPSGMQAVSTPQAPAIPSIPKIASSLSHVQSSVSSPTTFPSPKPALAQPNLTAQSSSFDDFDDFATPQNATTAKFDDFDFSSFETPATQPQTRTADPLPAPRANLDHTSTINLISNASSEKGKRWPAPPSPVGPILEPPPRAPSGGFPFLSPPPPSSRVTPRPGKGIDLLGEMAAPTAPVAAPPQAGSLVPPASVPQPAANASAPQSAPASKPGATDWSFFDNL